MFIYLQSESLIFLWQNSGVRTNFNLFTLIKFDCCGFFYLISFTKYLANEYLYYLYTLYIYAFMSNFWSVKYFIDQNSTMNDTKERQLPLSLLLSPFLSLYLLHHRLIQVSTVIHHFILIRFDQSGTFPFDLVLIKLLLLHSRPLPYKPKRKHARLN